jgi:PAS domain S-box-containing protein
MDKTEDAGKTKAQLIKELQTLRRQLAELQGREEKGREQEQKSPFRERDMLHVLMDNVPDWIFFKDAESRIVRSNKAHAQLLGFDDPQEVVGKSDFDFFPSQDAQKFYDEEQKMLRSGQLVVARLGQTPDKDGEMLWVSETKIPLKDETGQVIGLVGISRDVTDIKRAEKTLKQAHAEIEKQVEERTAELKREVAERKRTEAALAHESELLQALMDNSPDYFFFKDRESRFVRTNKAHAQLLLGLDGPQEAIGKTDFDLFSHVEAQRFYDEEQKIMETGQPVISREWSLTSSTTGELVWLSEHKLPIRDETGQVIGLVGISRDVTQIKEAKAENERLLAELERTYADVERQVRERTTELQQEIAKRERAQEESVRLQQEVITAQQRAIQELSTPIIPVLEGVIIMPLIGSIDTLRARDVIRNLLAGIREHHAKVVILDITGVPIVDSGVAAYLDKAVQAARLKGARTIVTGISEVVAETIVDLGIDWSGIETLRDLRADYELHWLRKGGRYSPVQTEQVN